MPRIATIMREDSSYPNGRPHDVYIKRWRLCGIMVNGLWNELVTPAAAVVEAESAFAARVVYAQLSRMDPMSLRVEEVP